MIAAAPVTARNESIVTVPAVMSSREKSALRVLHVGKFYPPHQGGMETHLQALCGELKDFVDVKVVVASDDRQTTEELIDGVDVARLGTICNLAAAPVCPELAGRIRGAQADIVQIHLPHPTAILAYLMSGHRGPLIFSYHSDIIRQKMLGKAFWPFLRHALNRAAAIAVATPNHISSSPVLQGYRDKCRIIPYGIPLEPFDRPDATEVERIHREYGERIVLGVGRLVYYKGFKYLIRAMKGVEAQLLIVGNGPLRVELEREIREHKVEAKVKILTDVRDVVPYYHAASVFALPSIARSEAFGIVQLEAMACGKPVLNTNLDSGVTFVSQNGVSGLTVPPEDAEALTGALNTLLADPALSAQYGRAGRRRVEQEFNLEVMTRRTLDLYEEVMRSSARR